MEYHCIHIISTIDPHSLFGLFQTFFVPPGEFAEDESLCPSPKTGFNFANSEFEYDSSSGRYFVRLGKGGKYRKSEADAASFCSRLSKGDDSMLAQMDNPYDYKAVMDIVGKVERLRITIEANDFFVSCTSREE